MRTTLTLDDDIAGLLKEQAKRRGVPFKLVVNETLRSGLGPKAQKVKEPPEVVSHSFGFPSWIDRDRMNQLADDLEVLAFLESYRKQVEE